MQLTPLRSTPQGQLKSLGIGMIVACIAGATLLFTGVGMMHRARDWSQCRLVCPWWASLTSPHCYCASGSVPIVNGALAHKAIILMSVGASVLGTQLLLLISAGTTEKGMDIAREHCV